METARPPTTQSMMLLLLLLYGATIGTALPKRELQMLEMMQSILGVDSSDFGGRSQRSGPMTYASSVPCDDSLSEESSDTFNLYDSDLDDSIELVEHDDCGRSFEPAPPATEEIEPCERPMVPMQHPCYVRVYLLRTPLKRHDPCKNFTLTTPPPTTTTSTTMKTTTTTKSPKPKCKKGKSKKSKAKASSAAKPLNGNKKTTTTTTQATTTTTEKEETTTTTTAKPDTTTTEVTTTTTVSTSNASPSTNDTTTEVNTTTEEVTSTTEEITTSTSPSTTTTTTATSLNPTTLSYTKNMHSKSLRGKKNKKNHKPKVPDPPKIKMDGTMQSSDTHAVFLSALAAVSRSHAMSTTLDPENDTITDCIESSSDEENDENEAYEEPEDSVETDAFDDYEDAEYQETNLCPQFSAPDEPANQRHMPTSNRFRKPVKNYVEPILYEGQFAKTRQRIGMLPPQRRDYYVSNKQIMPRPRPKFREPIPHSIYMNNIVRGLKCSDEVGGQRNNPPQPRPYQTARPTTSQRIWPNRRTVITYNPVGPQPQQQSLPRPRSNPLFGLNSAEESNAYGNDSDQYYDDESQELFQWPRDRSPQPTPPPPDPCQAELSGGSQMERDIDRVNDMMRKRERKESEERIKSNEQIFDYQRHMHPSFFT